MDWIAVFLKQKPDEWGTLLYYPTGKGLVVIVGAIFFLLILSCLLFRKHSKSLTAQVSFSSVIVSLAYSVSMIKIFRLPMGGSVTLFGMLFMSFTGYWYGLGAGITLSVSYGLLQMLTDPYMMNLPQVLIDYFFAFGAMGLSGLFTDAEQNGLQKGYLAAAGGRYIFAVLSGWLFFGSYAAEYGFSSPLLYSLVYNGLYIGAETLITLLFLSLPPVKRFLDKIKLLATGEKMLVEHHRLNF